MDKKTAAILEDYVDRQFINLVATAKVEFVKEYGGPGIVLYAVDIAPGVKPEDDLVYFN